MIRNRMKFSKGEEVTSLHIWYLHRNFCYFGKKICGFVQDKGVYNMIREGNVCV